MQSTYLIKKKDGLKLMVKLELLKLKLKSRIRYSLMVGLASLVVLGFTIWDLLNVANDQSLVIFDWVIIGFSSLLFIFSMYIVSGTVLDLNGLKKDIYIKIKAKFIKYSRQSVDPKNPKKVSYTGQIFINLETKEEEPLIVTDVIHNESYLIIYCKHSRLGIAIETL